MFYGLQYLTRGIHYFVDEDNNVKWRYLAFMAAMQFFISILITWSVVSAFSSQYLSQYESIKPGLGIPFVAESQAVVEQPEAQVHRQA